MVHEDCLELKGRAFHFGESSNDGDKAILCGSTVRLFDCKKQRCIQTISRMSNAETALAHDQKKMCLVDASRKGVTAAEFADENGLWVEKNRSLIKAINTDGGRPCFSSDDRYFFFTTDFCRLWRYTLGTGICECIWEKGFPDQLMQFDLYEDQILIISGSSEKPDHCGQRKDMVFDIAIFTAGDMKKIHRSEVDRYISMTHSVNSRYLLICSVGSCLRIDMGQA